MAKRALLVGLTLVAGCYGGGAFNCTTDTQCSGGVCTSDGFCAFADPMCPTGFKYGDLSGPKSGTCVGTMNSMPDAPVDMFVPDTPPGQVCGTRHAHAQ